MPTERKHFLIQSSGKRAAHWTRMFPDRSYAEEPRVHHYYRNDSWQRYKKDRAFGDVQSGDIVLQYCTLGVGDSGGTIREIWEVTGVEPAPEKEIKDALKSGKVNEKRAKELRENPHILRLQLSEKLDGGVLLSTIKEAVSSGELSKAMNNCGRLGFNIGEILETDHKALRKLDRETGAEPKLLEVHMQKHLTLKESADAIHPELAGYTLYKDGEGNIGALYSTNEVGTIDLLYINDQGNFLVVELKRTDDTSDKVVGQIARYMGWVRHKLADGNRVKGAIVTHSPSTELRYAVGELRDCSLYKFELDYVFTKTEHRAS